MPDYTVYSRGEVITSLQTNKHTLENTCANKTKPTVCYLKTMDMYIKNHCDSISMH